MSEDSESDYEGEETIYKSHDSNEWNPGQANILTLLDRMGGQHVTTRVEPSDPNQNKKVSKSNLKSKSSLKLKQMKLTMNKPQIIVLDKDVVENIQLAIEVDLNSYRSRLVSYQLFYKKETYPKGYEYLSLLIKALDRHQRVSRRLLSEIYKTLGDVVIPTLQK